MAQHDAAPEQFKVDPQQVSASKPQPSCYLVDWQVLTPQEYEEYLELRRLQIRR